MKNNKTYLVVSDLDGTLLNSKGELNSETIKSVNKIISEGHIFCIATGRSLIGSIDIYKKLSLKSLMINHNGSFISNPNDNDFAPIDLVFSKSIAIKILESKKIRDYITSAFLESKGIVYKFNDYNSLTLRQDLKLYFHIDINEEKVINLNNNAKKIEHDVYAMLLYLSPENTEYFDKLIYHIKNISPCLQVRMIKLLSDDGIIVEINTVFGDKSMGVNYLSSYYGIPWDRIITFGDGDNDIRMLTKFKYGFAMKNARYSCKILARHITKYTNDDNGVAWELNYFMNNKENIN